MQSKALFWIVAIVAAIYLQGQQDEYSQLCRKGMEALQAKDYDKAIDIYKKLVEVKPEDPFNYYNIACAYSMKNDVDAALVWFERAIELGFPDLDHIQRDRDLDNIRHTEKFTKITREAFQPMPCPPLELTDTGGAKVNIEQFRGRVVLLYFWGTWCPACHKQVPYLIDLHRQYQDHGLTIIGIADEGMSRIKKYEETNHIEFIMLRRPRAQKLTGPFSSIRRLPTTFLIDTQGSIVNTYIGYRDQKFLEEAILKLLPQRTDTAARNAPPEYVHQDMNKPEMQEMGRQSAGLLEKIYPSYKLVKIHEVATQAVDGTNYFVILEIESARGNILCRLVLHHPPGGESEIIELRQIK